MLTFPESAFACKFQAGNILLDRPVDVPQIDAQVVVTGARPLRARGRAAIHRVHAPSQPARGPSTTRYDRFTKRHLYQEVGVPVYWIVDADQQLVEVWTPHATFPTIERERVTWTPPAAPTSFTLELAELFQPI